MKNPSVLGRLTCLCVLFATLAAPVPASRAATWAYAASEHFELFLSGKEKDARQSITTFEGLHAFFEQFLRIAPGWRPKARVVIFAGPKEYELYRPRTNVQAYWLGTPDGDFIVLQSFDGATRTDAVHELAHMMIARTGSAYPLWLNEGLAQYYSTIRMSGMKMRLGLELPVAVDALRKAADAMSVDEVFGVDRELPAGTSPALEAVFYAESWALVHMLMNHDAYRDRAPALLTAIGSGASTPDALSTTYGKSAAAVSADLRKYLSRFRFDSTLVDAAPLLANLQITAGAPDDVDAALTLASVLGWQQGHEDEGRAALVALEPVAPNRLRLLEARGLLEYYTQRCGPARDYLGRAVGLGSTNPTVLRAAANLMAPTDPERSAALAGKAAKAAPMTMSGPLPIPMAPCVRLRP